MAYHRIMAAVALFAAMGHAQADIVESFESGSWSSDWIQVSGQPAGTVTTQAAHDGNYGAQLTGANWVYNTAIHFEPGQVLSAWFRPVGGSWGRFYLGFGSDASGTDGLVAATNTNDIRFQNNPGYDFIELNVSPQTWSDQWYHFNLTWNQDGSAVGQLFDADGTTLLNTVTQSGLLRSGRGIALRGFDNFYVDSIGVSAVPEPGAVSLMLAGLVGVAAGTAVRRRRG